jgi:hypothetical protein
MNSRCVVERKVEFSVSLSSVSSRFVVRVVVFPLQPFSTQQQKQQKRWIDKFIVHINNSLLIDQFNYLTLSYKSFISNRRKLQGLYQAKVIIGYNSKYSDSCY